MIFNRAKLISSAVLLALGLIFPGIAHATFYIIDYELYEKGNPVIADSSFLHGPDGGGGTVHYYLSGHLFAQVNDADNNGLDVGDTFIFLPTSNFNAYSDPGLTTQVDSFVYASGDTFQVYDVGGLLRPGLAGDQFTPANTVWSSITVPSTGGSAEFLPVAHTGSPSFYNSITEDHLALWGPASFDFDPRIVGADFLATGTVIPEPSSMFLMGVGGLWMIRRRRRKA